MDCMRWIAFLSVMNGVLSGADVNWVVSFFKMVIVARSWGEYCGFVGCGCWRQWRRFGMYPGILRST